MGAGPLSILPSKHPRLDFGAKPCCADNGYRGVWMYAGRRRMLDDVGKVAFLVGQLRRPWLLGPPPSLARQSLLVCVGIVTFEAGRLRASPRESKGSILGKGLAVVHAPKGGIRPGTSLHEGDLILESERGGRAWKAIKKPGMSSRRRLSAPRCGPRAQMSPHTLGTGRVTTVQHQSFVFVSLCLYSRIREQWWRNSA
ncbi:hypothetical protein VTJ49DRAFT_5431 [Mycothermus thermophilus]|uniref:Uncharacterized protein n=1 Tax=Humicola insolens TaxID=85995 RepID=A0ABR3VLL0_HUMIN